MAFLVPQGPQGGCQGVTGGHGGGGEALGGCHLPSRQLLLAAGQGPGPQGQGHSEVVPGEYGRPTFDPPSSLDTTPLDYGIWGFVESKACATPHPSMDALKASV